MDGLRPACANNKFIRYARVSGWVQARSRLMQYPRCETPARCRLSRAFYVTVALSRPAFPGCCIRHHSHGWASFSLLPRRCTVGTNTNRCINLALPRRAIAACVFVYLFHSIRILVTRPDVFPPSLSPHLRNLYFCYYWKSFLPGTRWKFISERGLTLSLSLPPPLLSLLFLSFILILYLLFCFSFSLSIPRSWNFCIANCTSLSY